MKKYLITGGCGFIGSNFIHFLLDNQLSSQIINLDKITYAGNKDNLSTIDDDNYHFIKGDICNQSTVRDILEKYNPNVLVHLSCTS